MADALSASLVAPSIIAIWQKKRELAAEWRRRNGAEPFDIVCRHEFDAYAGKMVARIVCGPVAPGTVKWSTPDGV